jgi:hypothetical protein
MVLNPSIAAECDRGNVQAQDGLVRMLSRNKPVQQAKEAGDGLPKLKPPHLLLRLTPTSRLKTNRKTMATNELQLQHHLGRVAPSLVFIPLTC